ncbi:MAG: DUF7144 family membrane protein [Actinomycetes bacterium]
MTDTTSSQGVGATVPRQASRATPEATGWVGWIIFAGTMMVLVGTFHIIQGLVAVFNDKYYLVAKSGLVVHVDYTAWGWVHMIGGVILIGAGLGLFTGRMWARVVGVIVAGASMLLNFAFIASYPFWSAIVIALDVFVILALTVHGREMKSV